MGSFGRFAIALMLLVVERKISKMRDHYIICGCGGKEVAMEFQREGVPFLIIERDSEELELGRDDSIIFLRGDAEDDETLIDADIMHAKGLVAALRQGEINVFVVLTARQLNHDLIIVARIESLKEFAEGKAN
jgi:voltage-gated potassium channel